MESPDDKVQMSLRLPPAALKAIADAAAADRKPLADFVRIAALREACFIRRGLLPTVFIYQGENVTIDRAEALGMEVVRDVRGGWQGEVRVAFGKNGIFTDRVGGLWVLTPQGLKQLMSLEPDDAAQDTGEQNIRIVLRASGGALPAATRLAKEFSLDLKAAGTRGTGPSAPHSRTWEGEVPRRSPLARAILSEGGSGPALSLLALSLFGIWPQEPAKLSAYQVPPPPDPRFTLVRWGTQLRDRIVALPPSAHLSQGLLNSIEAFDRDFETWAVGAKDLPIDSPDLDPRPYAPRQGAKYPPDRALQYLLRAVDALDPENTLRGSSGKRSVGGT